MGNSSRTKRNLTIAAPNISQASLWIISPTCICLFCFARTPQNVFIFRGRLKIFWINLQTTNRDWVVYVCINYTLPFRSPFAHYEIPCSLRQFPYRKKAGTEQNVQVLSQNLLGNLSKHPTQKGLISRSVMRVLIYKPRD